MKTKLIILLILFFSIYALPQVSVTKENNVVMTRGDSVVITLKVIGDKSTHALSFAVKEGTDFTDDRLIEKDTLDGISLSYSSPYTSIVVTIKPEDTQDLTAKTYYYDVYDSTAKQTIINAYLTIKADVQTPFDGTQLPGGTRFYVAGSFVENANHGDLFSYDSTTHTIQPISKDSVWNFLKVRDSVQTYVNDLQSEIDSIVSANDYYSLTFNYPIGGEQIYIEKTDFAFTIDSIWVSTKDSAITFNIGFSSDWDSTITNVFNLTQTVTGTQTFTSFASATIPKNYFLIFTIDGVDGSYGEILISRIYYRR